MTDLILPLKTVYFRQIKEGSKVREYRLVTPYWRKRLVGRSFRHVILLRAYPKGGGEEGVSRLTREWRGYSLETLKHEHFGPDPVEVFAIDVSTPAAIQGA